MLADGSPFRLALCKELVLKLRQCTTATFGFRNHTVRYFYKYIERYTEFLDLLG